MAKSYIGLDIESSEVYMSTSDGKTVFRQMPENLVKDGKVVSPESLSKFLKEVKKEGGIGGKNISFVLPDDATFFRNVNSPAVSDAQLKLNLPYEFRDFVGNNSIDYNYDYVVTSYEYDENEKVTGLNLLAAAANKKTVNEYFDILKRAGLKMKTALPREMALINIMNGVEDDKKEYCLVGVGYNQTNIYIFKGQKLTATKMIDVACRDIDIAIASNQNIDLFLAASHRDHNHNDVLSSEYLKSTYEKIALEIMKTINFYKYENQDSSLKDIYYFSMGCDNKPLKDTINSYIDFTEKDIRDLLPDEFKNNEDADRCLLSIGVTL